MRSHLQAKMVWLKNVGCSHSTPYNVNYQIDAVWLDTVAKLKSRVEDSGRGVLQTPIGDISRGAGVRELPFLSQGPRTPAAGRIAAGVGGGWARIHRIDEPSTPDPENRQHCLMPASEKPRAEQGPLAEAKTMQARTLSMADRKPEPTIFLVSSYPTDSRAKAAFCGAHPKMLSGTGLPLTSPQKPSWTVFLALC